MNELNLVKSALNADPQTIKSLVTKTNLVSQMVVYQIGQLKRVNAINEIVDGKVKMYSLVEVETSTGTVKTKTKDSTDSETYPKSKKVETPDLEKERTAKFESLDDLTDCVTAARKPILVADSDIKILLDAEYTPVVLANEKTLAKAEFLVATETNMGGHRPIFVFESDEKTYMISYRQGMDIEEREYVLYMRKKSDKKITYEHTKNFNRLFTKYKWNDETVRKGKLVLYLMKKFIDENPNITAKELQARFPDNLVKTFGLITTYNIAKKAEDRGSKQRYFGVVGPAQPWGKKQDQIRLASGDVYCVTNQIDKNNFPNIIEKFIEYKTISGWDALTSAE